MTPTRRESLSPTAPRASRASQLSAPRLTAMTRRPWCLRKKRPKSSTSCHRRRSKLCHQHPTRPVALDNVTHLHGRNPSYARVQIIGGRVFLVPSGFPAAQRGRQFHDYMRLYFGVLREVAATHGTPDVDLVLNPTDQTPPWPAFNQHGSHHGQWPVEGDMPGVRPIPQTEEPKPYPNPNPLTLTLTLTP